jgi:hypothetical protein
LRAQKVGGAPYWFALTIGAAVFLLVFLSSWPSTGQFLRAQVGEAAMVLVNALGFAIAAIQLGVLAFSAFTVLDALMELWKDLQRARRRAARAAAPGSSAASGR